VEPVKVSAVPSENLIRWIRSRKENRIMIETDGDLLQTSARIYVGVPFENLIRGGFAGVIESGHARGRWLRSSGC
jgi:hypothetical protein